MILTTLLPNQRIIPSCNFLPVRTGWHFRVKQGLCLSDCFSWMDTHRVYFTGAFRTRCISGLLRFYIKMLFSIAVFTARPSRFCAVRLLAVAVFTARLSRFCTVMLLAVAVFTARLSRFCTVMLLAVAVFTAFHCRIYTLILVTITYTGLFVGGGWFSVCRCGLWRTVTILISFFLHS